MRSLVSTRHAVLDAYQTLIAGDARPLLRLLHPDVLWVEAHRSRRLTIAGRDAVAARLERVATQRTVTPFDGLVVCSDALIFSFRRPWWEEKPRRLRALLAAALNGAFTQTVRFGHEIERIESGFGFAPPRLHETDPCFTLEIPLER